jgi:hypothetical protein
VSDSLKKKVNGGKRAVITGLYENRGSDALCRKIYKVYKGMISLELWRDPVMVIFSDKIYSFSRWEFYLIK